MMWPRIWAGLTLHTPVIWVGLTLHTPIVWVGLTRHTQIIWADLTLHTPIIWAGLTLHTPMTITVMSVPLLLLCFPALLQNQKRQMQKLQEAISHQRIIVNKLRSEVSVMETSMIESSHVNRSLPSVSVCTCETYSFILSHVDHFMPSVIIHLVLLTYPVPFKMHLVGCYSIIS